MGLFAAIVFAALAPQVAQAAPAAPADPKPAAKKKAESGKSGKPAGKTPLIKRSPTGNKSISLDDEFMVEGKLEKPSAFYVLRRSATDYDWARMDAVFTPLVLESVQDPLF